MTRSCLWGLMICGLLTGLVSLLLYSSAVAHRQEHVADKKYLVATLQLTDLSLCSEARYTRHPTQADLFSAFQDSPAGFEHFPTGSLILPHLSGFNSRVQILPSDSKGK